MKSLLLFSLLLSVALFSCKKCYECEKDELCALCVEEGTTPNTAIQFDICRSDYFSNFEFQNDVEFYDSTGYNCNLYNDQDQVTLCERGIVNKSILFFDVEVLESDGYNCINK